MEQQLTEQEKRDAEQRAFDDIAKVLKMAGKDILTTSKKDLGMYLLMYQAGGKYVMDMLNEDK